MKPYLPYIFTLAGFLILFVVSRGTFRAGAAFLRKHLPSLAGCASEETVSRALIIMFGAVLLGAAEEYRTRNEDTAAKGYILRSEYGEAEDTAELAVTVDGKQHDLDLNIRAREMSEEEIDEVFEKAEARLPVLVLQGMPADHVDRQISLPEKIDGLPLTVSWITDRPDILDWDGMISSNVPDGGTKVTLTAEIIFEDEIREMELHVTVFPELRDEEESFLKSVKNAIETQNDSTKSRVNLPGTIDGRPAFWSQRGADTGLMLLMLGVMTAAVFIYSKVRRQAIERDQRNMKMKLDYPNIVNKLVLLVSAGMSLRSAFARIRNDYQRSLAGGGTMKPGYEEIAKTAYEMEHGVSEAEAYAHLGQRCEPREYKTFATLLSQSVTRGGSEMNEILRQEAFNAVEERKKRARVLGEEAGTKLLLPMMLMLVVVMVILMVPAMMAFL